MMKEPSREAWADDFLSEAHDCLNKAAAYAELCHQGNEARLLIGRALTIARQSSESGVLGRWPAEAIEKVRQAQAHLHRIEWSPEADRALYFCDDAARLLEEGGKLKPEFSSRAQDREAAQRFFGAVKVSHNGKGYGIALEKPFPQIDKDPAPPPGRKQGSHRRSRVRRKETDRDR